MNKETSKYITIIAAIVLLVAVVSITTGTKSSMLTGNVVSEDVTQTSFLGFTRMLVGVTLIGACIYLYKHSQ
ncbi:MAG: hypothetical protein ACP5NW_03920 [Candidatus Woesearchaeota archaeon]